MKKSMAVILTLMLMACFSGGVLAGDLDSPAPPGHAGSAMYTLEDLYNRLDTGAAGSKRAGAFTEPTAGPGPTGHTLDEVMGKMPAVDDINGAGVAEVLAGKTFWGLTSGAWGSRTGNITNNGAGGTITPGTSGQTVAAGYWSSANTVSGDADLIAGNIKSGVNIFGVTGDCVPTGTIVAWGYNNGGQCNVPAPNSGFTAVAAGGYHNLGLKSDGTIVAWGYNNGGQCNVPAPNSGFTAVAGGLYHNLGLK